MIIDIKRAYFYALSQRDTYVKLPPEDPKAGDPNICGKLAKSLYGTRDAGANWHAAYSAFLKSIDLLQGTTNPCHFFSADQTIKGLVHGDDFLFTGSAEKLGWLRGQFEKQYDCKVEIIGHKGGAARSARFLNRVITYTERGMEFEADQRLVEALIDDLSPQGR